MANNILLLNARSKKSKRINMNMNTTFGISERRSSESAKNVHDFLTAELDEVNFCSIWSKRKTTPNFQKCTNGCEFSVLTPLKHLVNVTT